MQSYWEYLLFIGIIVCLWGAWCLRINGLNPGRRWNDGNGRRVLGLLIAAAIGALILLVSR